MRTSITRANQINQIDQIMYEIVWHAQKQITHTLTQPQIDLTLPQLMTLFAVRHAGSCRMSELAEQTRQSAGTLTGIVDRLIADGLLDRARNVSDRRVIEVALTPEGERRLTEAKCSIRLNSFRITNSTNFGDCWIAFAPGFTMTWCKSSSEKAVSNQPSAISRT